MNIKTLKILALLQEVSVYSLSLNKGTNHRESNIVGALTLTNNSLATFSEKRCNLQMGHYVRRCTTIHLIEKVLSVQKYKP